MKPDAEKYRALLSAKTKDELNVIAKQLRTAGFRRLSSDLLVETIVSDNSEAPLIPSSFIISMLR